MTLIVFVSAAVVVRFAMNRPFTSVKLVASGVMMFLLPVTSMRTGRSAIGRPDASQIATAMVTLSTASATRGTRISSSKASTDPFSTITTLDAAALGRSRRPCALPGSHRAEAAQSGRMRISAPVRVFEARTVSRTAPSAQSGRSPIAVESGQLVPGQVATGAELRRRAPEGPLEEARGLPENIQRRPVAWLLHHEEVVRGNDCRGRR